MTRGFVTGAPLGSYSTYCFAQPRFFSPSFSPIFYARELPRLHLTISVSGPYHKTGEQMM